MIRFKITDKVSKYSINAIKKIKAYNKDIKPEIKDVKSNTLKKILNRFDTNPLDILFAEEASAIKLSTELYVKLRYIEKQINTWLLAPIDQLWDWTQEWLEFWDILRLFS